MELQNTISKQSEPQETAKHNCGFCEKVFRFKSNLTKHLVVHTKEKPFKCQECSKVFPSSSNLKGHIQSLHKNKKYVCPVQSCGASLANAGSLYRHLKVKHEPESHMNALIPCSICKKNVRKASLYAHLRRHTIGNRYKCDKCEKSFFQPSDLKNHQNTHLSSELRIVRLLKCKECEESFKSVLTLKCHIAKIHKNLDKNDNDLNLENNVIAKVNGELGNMATQHENLQAKQTEQQAKNYPCGLCATVFPNKSGLKKHLNSHTNEKPFKCQECDKSFSGATGLRSHIDYIHKKIKHLCPFPNCGKYLANPWSLKIHLGTHDPVTVKNSRLPCPICNDLVPKTSFHGHVSRHINTSKKYKCDKCDKVFRAASDLKRHSILHLPSDEKYPFCCNLCDFKTSHSTSLTYHMKARHPLITVELHCCSFCDKQFRNHENLIQHLRSHIGEKPFKCQICESAFISQLLLTKHIKSKHSVRVVNWHSCSYCPKKFRIERSLKSHLQKHEGIFKKNAYPCPTCGKVLTSKHGLKNHLHVFHGPKENNYKCALCPKCFNTKDKLRSHSAVHNDARPYTCTTCEKTYRTRRGLDTHIFKHLDQTFTCDICDRSFKAPQHLNAHVLLYHRAEKKYKCKFCDNKFKNHARLNNHMQYHLGEKRVSCSQCLKNFCDKYSLTRHMMVAHKTNRNCKNKRAGVPSEAGESESPKLDKYRNRRNIKCRHCSKSFLTNKHLTQHLIMHRLEIEYSCKPCIVLVKKLE